MATREISPKARRVLEVVRQIDVIGAELERLYQEFERLAGGSSPEVVSQKIKDGQARAIAAGKRIGTPPVMTEDQVAKAGRLRDEKYSWHAISRQLGVPVSTIRNALCSWRSKRKMTQRLQETKDGRLTLVAERANSHDKSAPVTVPSKPPVAVPAKLSVSKLKPSQRKPGSDRVFYRCRECGYLALPRQRRDHLLEIHEISDPTPALFVELFVAATETDLNVDEL